MKILMIGSSFGIDGGLTRYIQNLLYHIDLKRYQVELIGYPVSDPAKSIEKNLKSAGVILRYMPEDKNQYIRFFHQFFKENRDYDIVHLHTPAKLWAPVAMDLKLQCPRTRLIVHAHTCMPPVTLGWRLAQVLYRLSADYFLACGVDAGKFVFGENAPRRKNFSVACNAVDKTRFCPDGEKRNRLRAEYGIRENQRVLGFVGRYDSGKNVLWLAEVFAAFHRMDPDSLLLMVGSGDQKQEMTEKLAALGLTDSVIHAGLQTDIPAYMNAFDAFLLPSLYEGSPVTLIEAQGCGCPCFASANVPRDGEVTPIIRYLPLADGPEKWAEEIDRTISARPHEDYWPQLAQAGYEWNAAGKRMEQIYDKLMNV